MTDADHHVWLYKNGVNLSKAFFCRKYSHFELLKCYPVGIFEYALMLYVQYVYKFKYCFTWSSSNGVLRSKIGDFSTRKDKNMQVIATSCV